MTRRWWAHLRQSPQGSVLTALDWDYALDVALLHHGFWSSDGADHAAELRLRQAKLGCTPEDRARLRWAIGEPAKGPSEPRQSRYGHLRAVVEASPPAEPS
jgi:hypothetical protein